MKRGKARQIARDGSGNVVVVTLHAAPVRLLSNAVATQTLWKVHKGYLWPLWKLN